MITLFYLSIYLIIQFEVGCRKPKSRRDQNIKAHYQYFLTWSSHSFQIPTHESMTETPEPTHQTQNPRPNFTISEHSTPSMANTGEGSSANAKPVIVRVKRKAFQSLLEAFCEFQATFFIFIFTYPSVCSLEKVCLGTKQEFEYCNWDTRKQKHSFSLFS